MTDTPYSQVRVLSRRETIKVIGVDERTFDRLEAAGDAPPKTQLSKRRIGYRLIDIDAWLNASPSGGVMISESTIRRRARRQGYTVVKSRTQPPFNGGDYGEYALIGRYGGAVLGWDYDATLQDIADYLSDEPVSS